MKKILNIVLGEISTGELSIAISTEKNMDKRKYKVHYLIPEQLHRILGDRSDTKIYRLSREQNPLENQKLILDIFEEEKYDLVILFDAFTFEYAQDWTGMNSDLLKKCNVPVVSLDEYEYTKAGYKIDYYGLFIKRLPPLLEHCDFVIKNCPMTMVNKEADCYRQGEKKNEYYYRFFEQPNLISKEEKEQIRKAYFGVTENQKVILFTTSKWEVHGAYSFSSQNRLTKWLGTMLYEYVKTLGENVILVHIGNENWTIDSTNESVKYIQYDSLPVDIFEKVLQSIDLYITYNLVSITLTKAVIFEVPSLVLNNSKMIDFNKLEDKLRERPKWYQEMARDVKKVYPFTASMFGWNRFLTKVVEDNSYVDTFLREEFFNYNKMVATLKKALFDETLRVNLINKNHEFIDNYFKLPIADKIMDAIFEALEAGELII